jgi:hypothetical protein
LLLGFALLASVQRGGALLPGDALRRYAPVRDAGWLLLGQATICTNNPSGGHAVWSFLLN